jgi:hypothetical protein
MGNGTKVSRSRKFGTEAFTDMKSRQEKIERIIALLNEGKDERILDLVLSLLQYPERSNELIEELQLEESEKGSELLIRLQEMIRESKERILEEKMRSRAARSRSDIEKGHTHSIEEVRTHTDEYLRRRYEG